MQRFFDVVLADSSAVRDSENMAVYYIPLDRTKTRMELKEFSELDELVKTSLDNNAWLEERRDNADTDEQAVIDMEVRQQILELLLRLDVFKVAEERSKADILWRDYYLERSRTLYEQEVKSDLGDAMTQQSKARLQQQQIQFCRAMALAQLNALQGKPVWPLPTAAAKTEAPAAQKEQPK